MDNKKTAGQIARDYFSQNYSCSESVWLALSADMPEAERNFGLKLAGAFSGGCGNGALCGAVAGAILGAGRWYGRTMGEPRNPDCARTVKLITDAFKAKYGSLDCRDLKATTDNWRDLCTEFVEFVANIADQALDAAGDDDCG